MVLSDPEKCHFGRHAMSDPFRDMLRDSCYYDHKGNSTYVSLAVIFPLMEAWITTSNSCLHSKSKLCLKRSSRTQYPSYFRGLA